MEPAASAGPDGAGLDGGPDYRVWPPVAVFVPLIAAIALTESIGEAPFLDLAWARPIGLVLLGVFAGWNGWALVLMSRQRTGLLPGQETRVVLAQGPFAVSRNPLYVGLVVVYLAIALMWPSLWALALTPLVVAGLWWGAITPEERYLRAKFGDEYSAYCERVRRWL